MQVHRYLIFAWQRAIPSMWKQKRLCNRVQDAEFKSIRKVMTNTTEGGAACARVDERESTTLTREDCFPWGNPRPCSYISLAIREPASNPMLKNHERIPHQLLMKVAGYSHRFYTCNMHQKLVMMFQYDVGATVFVLFQLVCGRFTLQVHREQSQVNKTSC